MYLSGLDLLEKADVPGGRAGVLTHYAAVDSSLRNSLEVISSLDRFTLSAIFGPQHGFFGETQDNMIEWDGYRHPRYRIPVYSLYGEVREPTSEMLHDLDVILIDLQDIGARYYTYIYAMAFMMRAAAASGIPVVVLDRPNPLGIRIVEGKLLNPEFTSYVGMYPLPPRHALTIAEAAGYFASVDSLPEPVVVKQKDMSDSGFPDSFRWVQPSPNMPTLQTAAVYPGMCLLEGTNLSEGRGTTRPFEIIGAPWLNGEEIAEKLNESKWVEGAVLRPHCFIPTFGKHKGVLCKGVQIHIKNSSVFRSFRAALGFLAEAWRYGESCWKEPPYEYEYEKLPIDILSGSEELRRAVEDYDIKALLELSKPDLKEYFKKIESSLLYQRKFEQ